MLAFIVRHHTCTRVPTFDAFLAAKAQDKLDGSHAIFAIHAENIEESHASKTITSYSKVSWVSSNHMIGALDLSYVIGKGSSIAVINKTSKINVGGLYAAIRNSLEANQFKISGAYASIIIGGGPHKVQLEPVLHDQARVSAPENIYGFLVILGHVFSMLTVSKYGNAIPSYIRELEPIELYKRLAQRSNAGSVDEVGSRLAKASGVQDIKGMVDEGSLPALDHANLKVLSSEETFSIIPKISFSAADLKRNVLKSRDIISALKRIQSAGLISRQTEEQALTFKRIGSLKALKAEAGYSQYESYAFHNEGYSREVGVSGMLEREVAAEITGLTDN